jgi:hypothetical protein
MIMQERAIKLFLEAWGRIKNGDFYDEDNNRAFEYTLKSLISKFPKQKAAITSEVLKDLPDLIARSKGNDKPPPFLYILISIKNAHINKVIQETSIVDYIKSNGSEESVYSLLNLIETFAGTRVEINNFVNTIIKNTNEKFNKDMVEALAYMISAQHPEYLPAWIKKFAIFADNTILKSFINMNGRQGMLIATQVLDPNKLVKLLGKKK